MGRRLVVSADGGGLAVLSVVSSRACTLLAIGRREKGDNDSLWQCVHARFFSR
jgi:hypothetical protein